MKNKKLLILLLVLLLLAAAGAALWFNSQNSREPVNVFPFRYLGMTEYWGDNQESYGPVSTDRIQTVYVTDTQIITEINVKEGDAVKKGDILLTFDTTLSDLAVERKRLDVEKKKLQLQKAKDKLREINNMKPMVIPDFSDEDEDDGDEYQGEELKDNYTISTNSDFDGSSQSKALICWMRGGKNITSTVFEEVRARAEKYQRWNAEQEEDSDEDSEPEAAAETGDSGETGDGGESGGTGETGAPSEGGGSEDTKPPLNVTTFYMIVKVTDGNKELGRRSVWQGLRVEGNAQSGFGFRLFDAYGVQDHMLDEDEEDADTSIPEIDYGSGYTAAQIAQMRSEKQKEIKELEFEIKMVEAEYKIMLTEVEDGNVYAEIDGKVVSVLPEEDARLQNQPIVKVSGGGGFYIEGSISELEKDKLQLGQEVTINDWNSGGTYTGKITSLGDFPSQNDSWNGNGNPNASYYPFIAFVDETADLQAGSYASIQFSTAGAEQGVYLEKAFIRSEQGRHYVYLRGDDGKLEKRYVTVGKSLWGSYTQILTGVGEEDLLAFPYGKNLKEGADTVEKELSALYE